MSGTGYGPQLPGLDDLEAADEAATVLHFARIEAEDTAFLARKYPDCRLYQQDARDAAGVMEDARAEDAMHSAARALAHHQPQAEPEAGQ